MSTDKYDQVLIGILQNEGAIAEFLDAIIGFLYRRTDFFRIMTSSTDKMGFTPGTALKLLTEAFRKYERIAAEDIKRREKLEKQKMRKLEQDKTKDTQKTPESLDSTQNQRLQSDTTNASKQTQPSPNTSTDQSLQTSTAPSNQTMSTSQTNTSTHPPVSTNQSHAQSTASPSLDHGDTRSSLSEECKSKPDDDIDPELARQQAVFQGNSDSYNGAIRDNYAWSQSITDLDIHVKIPKTIRKGKDVKVVIDKKHIKASYRDDTGNMVCLVDDDLSWEINKEEAMWNLVPGEHILINLDKKQERWWESLLVSEPKISVRKIDASRPMTDLDDEAQTKIEEMMYNERQKRLGLPQTHEKKVQNVLAEAWNAEGSPFRGQPFDPSKINVGQEGMITINDDKMTNNQPTE